MNLIKITNNGPETTFCDPSALEGAVLETARNYENAKAELNLFISANVENLSEEIQLQISEAKDIVQRLKEAYEKVSENDQALKIRYNDLIEKGFQEFIITPPPSEIEEGKILSDSFETVDGKVIQSWSLKDDPKFFQKKIEDLKASLSATDYKVTKCYEATMLGEELPYDLTQLASERSFMRSEINRIEALIENL